jgi:hypothetical protein
MRGPRRGRRFPQPKPTCRQADFGCCRVTPLTPNRPPCTAHFDAGGPGPRSFHEKQCPASLVREKYLCGRPPHGVLHRSHGEKGNSRPTPLGKPASRRSTSFVIAHMIERRLAAEMLPGGFAVGFISSATGPGREPTSPLQGVPACVPASPLA